MKACSHTFCHFDPPLCHPERSEESVRLNSSLFTYATSSEHWGSGNWQYGKYAVKIYTIDGVLIYQTDNGDGNAGKIPKGGVINQGSTAESMAISIANPITYYAGSPYTVISQSGHSKDLYNYYWSSYSRGVDGRYLSGGVNDPQWHNVYLDGYIPLRVKSIYDPCPYLYRIPSHGTYNQFTLNPGWTEYSYLGGASFNINTEMSWLSGLGYRNGWSSVFDSFGRSGSYFSSTTSGQTVGYTFLFYADKGIYPNHSDYIRSYGLSVRCIEVTRRYAHTFLSKKVCKNSRATTLSFRASAKNLFIRA